MSRKRRPTLGLLIALLIGIIAVVALRWNAWFAIAPEPRYELSRGIQRVLVTTTREGTAGRVLTWVSGDSAAMRLVAGGESTVVTPEPVKTMGGVTYVFCHKFQDLAPGRYPYEIVGKSETFRDTISINFPGRSEELICLGDIQDREKGLTRDFLRSVGERYPDADAWLFLGDLIERGNNDYWEIFYEGVRDVAPHTAFVPTVGNHEYYKGFSKKRDPRWVYEFPNPMGERGASLPYHYYVDYPHARVVVLDTNKLPFGIVKLSRWLRQVLSERRDHPFFLVTMHHGVHSMARGRANLAENMVLGRIFKEYGVHLVLQGHDHVYARLRREETRAPLYVTLTTSLKSYGISPDVTKLEAGADTGRYYLVLKVGEKVLTGDLFREDHTLFDHFTLTK